MILLITRLFLNKPRYRYMETIFVIGIIRFTTDIIWTSPRYHGSAYQCKIWPIVIIIAHQWFSGHLQARWRLYHLLLIAKEEFLAFPEERVHTHQMTPCQTIRTRLCTGCPWLSVLGEYVQFVKPWSVLASEGTGQSSRLVVGRRS